MWERRMRAVAYASAYWAMTKNEDEEKVRQYQRNIGVLMASTLERSVIITNLSRKATQQHLIDFFTFCGGIESLVIEEGSPFNTAIVVFDSVSAAKTASVVSSALIVDAPIRVQLRSASKAVIGDSSDVPAASKTYSAAEPSVSEVKPGFLARSIGAAYCAWKTLDFKYGVSEKAKSTASSVKSKFDSFDQENHITATIKDKLDAVDSKFGISAKSQNAARIVDSKLNEVKETAPIQSATSTVKQGVQQLTSVIDQVKAETQVFIRSKAECDSVLAQALCQEQQQFDDASLVNGSAQPVASATI